MHTCERSVEGKTQILKTQQMLGKTDATFVCQNKNGRVLCPIGARLDVYAGCFVDMA